MENDQLSPTIFILYGATGDLAKRMVLPAFYGLFARGLLPNDWRLVGNGRGDVDDDAFRSEMREALDAGSVTVKDEDWSRFAQNLSFAGHGFTEDDPGQMLEVVSPLRSSMGESSELIHYLAVPPTSFRGFTAAIKAHGLNSNAKAIFEKPYGTSPDDFETLDELVHTVFDEADIFRIDHFLGKEATQNIHTLRFANRMVESIWNRQHVAAVQIDIPETLDVTDRAVFYDQTGALLDMIVTHLFQLAAEVAMEPPLSMSADDLADARETVIDAFRPLAPEDVVLGQFEGYTEIDGVNAQSRTDTFVAARLWVDTDRWIGVPFLLRTGKKMAAKAERVTLIFRQANSPLHHQPTTPSSISFDLSGAGAIETTMTIKQPGPGTNLSSGSSTIELSSLGEPLEAYERLIRDALLSDKGRYTRPDGLRFAWETLKPLLAKRPQVHSYAPGSWGPAQASYLAEPHGWLCGE